MFTSPVPLRHFLPPGKSTQSGTPVKREVIFRDSELHGLFPARARKSEKENREKLGTIDFFRYCGKLASDYNGLLPGSRSNKNNGLSRFVQIHSFFPLFLRSLCYLFSFSVLFLSRFFRSIFSSFHSFSSHFTFCPFTQYFSSLRLSVSFLVYAEFFSIVLL